MNAEIRRAACYPREGYREKCATDVCLGTLFANDIPVTIAGALGRGAFAAGTFTTTGDNGMTEENLPRGIDQRSACRHPDWTGLELREITDWEKPIYVKIVRARPFYDTTLAVKSGANAVALDGRQGGTAATQDMRIENVGMPILACIPLAVRALQELAMHRKVQLVVSDGIPSGADVAKAMAADLIALRDNDPAFEAETRILRTTAGADDDWHEGRNPAGITTQDPERVKRLDPVLGGRRLKTYLRVLSLEAQTIVHAHGKNNLHNLGPEDLNPLTVENAAVAGVPLAGTNWITGR